jgi:hypothetical protein
VDFGNQLYLLKIEARIRDWSESGGFPESAVASQIEATWGVGGVLVAPRLP